MWRREQLDSRGSWLDAEQEPAGPASSLKNENEAPAIGLHGVADLRAREDRFGFPNQCMETERIHGTNYTEGGSWCKGHRGSKSMEIGDGCCSGKPGMQPVSLKKLSCH